MNEMIVIDVFSPNHTYDRLKMIEADENIEVEEERLSQWCV